MQKSNLFHDDNFFQVQARIKDFLNTQEDYLSKATANSPRAVGDAVQELLGAQFESILGSELCANYSANFARRAMADLAFEDRDGFYYIVDVKTHRLSAKFNMPNLTSVERLARFYEDDSNVFVLLIVSYDVEGMHVEVEDVKFVPIEFLDWSCLTIGALGNGQIQIANSNIITVNPRYSRKQWMIELCDTLLEFYPKEIGKIEKRLERFRTLKERWEARPE